MPDDLVERIKADREAGTRGPWCVGPVDDTRVEASDGSVVSEIYGDYNQPETWPMMEANARRIARVPEMEARILADAEALKAADELLNDAKYLEIKVRYLKGQLSFAGQIEQREAAYRKARGGSE